MLFICNIVRLCEKPLFNKKIFPVAKLSQSTRNQLGNEIHEKLTSNERYFSHEVNILSQAYYILSMKNVFHVLFKNVWDTNNIVSAFEWVKSFVAKSWIVWADIWPNVFTSFALAVHIWITWEIVSETIQSVFNWCYM